MAFKRCQPTVFLVHHPFRLLNCRRVCTRRSLNGVMNLFRHTKPASRVVLTLSCLLFCLACTHSDDEISWGIQENHASYVPARIAVLECTVWPNGARFEGLPLTNFKESDLSELCSTFNQFVIRGFEGQPYMRGLSPRAVKKALTTADQANYLKEMDGLWIHQSDDCDKCTLAPAFYSKSIANRQAWKMWLTRLSRMTRNADAILIPFITYGSDRSYDDRGIRIHATEAGVALLLIDTNNANLLWAGGRRAQATNKILENQGTAKPEPPAKEILYDRLFRSDIWKEFPGRQVYE